MSQKHVTKQKHKLKWRVRVKKEHWIFHSTYQKLKENTAERSLAVFCEAGRWQHGRGRTRAGGYWAWESTSPVHHAEDHLRGEVSIGCGLRDGELLCLHSSICGFNLLHHRLRWRCQRRIHAVLLLLHDDVLNGSRALILHLDNGSRCRQK